MSEQRNEDLSADKARELFDESVSRLDAATLSRLNKGRHDALERLQHARLAQQWRRWVPATGIAAAVLLTVMVTRGPGMIVAPDVPATVTDFEILMDEEGLEMLEDLEFYSWIDPADFEGAGSVG